MDGRKTQAVFLIDTCPLVVDQLQTHHRALCLLCTRLLLYLSQFPGKEHATRVGWNYTLFNSRRPEKSVRAKTAQFHESRLELLEKMFDDIRARLEASSTQHTTGRSPRVPRPPVRHVYTALASTVQDFVWDAPEISSPVRPMPVVWGQRSKWGVARARLPLRNVIFVCSPCPQSRTELAEFCGGLQERSDTGCLGQLRSELLPRALLSQLKERGIAVHWIDSTLLCGGSSTQV